MNIISKSPIVERKDSRMQIVKQGKNRQNSVENEISNLSSRKNEQPQS